MNGTVYEDVSNYVPTDSMSFDAVFVNSGNPVYTVKIYKGDGSFDYNMNFVNILAEHGFSILEEDYKAPKKEGYILKGYSKKSGGKDIYVTEEELLALPITGNLSLYPVFEEIATLTSVSFTEKTMDLGAGGSRKAEVIYKPDNAIDKSLIWTTSNPAIADVDQEGVITGVSYGTATITATSAVNTKATATLTVNVHEPLKSIEITNAPETIDCGDSLQLLLAYDPNDEA